MGNDLNLNVAQKTCRLYSPLSQPLRLQNFDANSMDSVHWSNTKQFKSPTQLCSTKIEVLHFTSECMAQTFQISRTKNFRFTVAVRIKSWRQIQTHVQPVAAAATAAKTQLPKVGLSHTWYSIKPLICFNWHNYNPLRSLRKQYIGSNADSSIVKIDWRQVAG